MMKTRYSMFVPALLLGVAACVGNTARAQTGSPGVQTAQNAPATAQPAYAATKKKSTSRKKAVSVQTIRMETAPPIPPSSAAKITEAQQRAADQKLLAQQQAASDRAAQENAQQVRRAQQQQQRVQNEVRIQDAPGPQQTGVVPAAGPPVAPSANPEQRIQDAPGPAQTLPPVRPVPQR